MYDLALPGPPAARSLARTAAAELRLPTLQVATAPPRGGVQLVGVDVWFWARGARPRSVTASIPGLSATATARPVGLRVAVGGSGAATCPGPGLPYGTSTPPGRACTVVLERPGLRRVEVALRWEVTWTSSIGLGGRLPDVVRVARFPLAIEEGRGVTD